MKKLIKLIIIFVIPYNLFAQEIIMQEIIIEDHRFIPDKLTFKSNQRIKLIVKNQDDTVEEFESFDLKREKIIPAKGEIKVTVGPLKAGEYRFFGEFHEKTAQGVINIIDN